MVSRSRRSFVLCVGVLTCIATVTSVTWLSSLIAAHHAVTSQRTRTHRGHQLLAGTAHEGTTTREPIVRVTEKEFLSSERAGKVDATTTTDKFQRSKREKARTGSSLRDKSAGAAKGKSRARQPPASCSSMPNTEYWGDALEWGSMHRKDTAEECCDACRNYKPLNDEQPVCNIWVYCGDKDACGEHYRECWLKHLAHPEGSKPKSGPQIPWMSGVFGLAPPVDYEGLTAKGGEDRTYHVVVTAQGPNTHWQARVHYYWYKKVQKECRARGICHMGGWTRLLHSGEPDELMNEVPTHVVKPLQDKDNKGYVVLNRPWAFVQWLREVEIPEKYVLMSEPDHIWLKPMPNLMLGAQPASFPFFYIEPAKADYVHITEKFTGKLTRRQLESISPIGNAPTLLAYSDLKRVAETWMNTSHAIFDDDEAHKAWGWVLEMYGFALSCFKVGIPPATLHLKMMAQPPWDNDVPYGPSFYLLHYTYGMDYTKEGKFTPGEIGEWRFDKRSLDGKPIPRNLGEPPPGMDNTLVRHMINAFNEATTAIPGWDEYAKTGLAKELWDGRL